MSLRLILTTLLLAAILLASTTVFGIRQASAFDPGGPPPRGGVPTVVTGNWEWVNYQPTGGSYSPQQEINNNNVGFLEMKWIFPYTSIGDQHGFSRSGVVSNPQEGSSAPALVIDGIVYVAKNDGRIHAVNALDGSEVWTSEGISQVDFAGLVVEFPYLEGSRGHTHAINFYRDQGWLMMSNIPCYQAAWNIEDGSLAWEMFPDQLCGTNEELGDPALAAAQPGQGIGSLGNQGLFPSIKNHPPSFMGDIMIIPVMGASGAGGRSSIRGFDMSNPQNPVPLYRTWLAPPAQGDPNWAIDQCDIVNGNGWFFERPEFLRSGQLAKNCRDVPDDVLLNDWINLIPDTPHFGKVHTSSAVSPVWGNMPISQTTGFVYMGTGDIGAYPNGSFRYGPNLHGSGIVALDATTGELKWFFAAVPHDLWDQDCSWGGIIANSGGTEVLIKGCKSGNIFALNSLTGEPLWVYDSPALDTIRDFGSGAGGVAKDENGNVVAGGACCDMTKHDMSRPWMNCAVWNEETSQCTDTTGVSQGAVRTACYTECLESDIAYDGERVYVGLHVNRGLQQVLNVRDFGNNGQGLSATCDECIDTGVLEAIDINTGDIVWSLQLGEASGFRGGILVTGGVVYAYASDGNLYMVNSETGELLAKKFFGIPVSVAPTIGMDSNGDHKIFLHIGGGGGFLFASNQLPGNLAAFGLPDVLPEPEIVEVIREVPGPERVVEVPGPERIVEVEVPGAERIVEVEVPGPEVVVEVQVPGPERIVEVPGPEVQVQTISPISYVAIGLGVVLIVISGVLFTRRRGT